MPNFIFLCIQQELELLAFYILICAFLDDHLITYRRRFCIASCFSPLLVICGYFLTNGVILGLFSILFVAVSIQYIFRKPIMNLMLMYLLSYALLCSYEVALLGISVLFHSAIETPLEECFALLSMNIICLLLYRFVPLRIVSHILFIKNRTIRIIIWNSFMLLVFIAILYRIDFENYIEVSLFIIVCVMVVIFINLEVITTHSKLISQKQRLDAYDDYMPIIDNLIKEIHSRQHDYVNHLQSLKMLTVTQPDYDSLCNAMNKHMNQFVSQDSISDLLKINLHLISGLLIGKCSDALNAGKQLNVIITSYNLETIVPEFELVDLFGILIDNAIEATNCDIPASLTISSNKNKLKLITKNIGSEATPEFCNNIFKNGYSTKNRTERPGGIGLFNLKKIVDYYNGSITLYNEEDTDGHRLICFEVEV